MDPYSNINNIVEQGYGQDAQLRQQGIGQQGALAQHFMDAFMKAKDEAYMRKMQEAKLAWEQKKFDEQTVYNQGRDTMNDNRYRDLADERSLDRQNAQANFAENNKQLRSKNIFDALNAGPNSNSQLTTSMIKNLGGDPTAYGTAQDTIQPHGPLADPNQAFTHETQMSYQPGAGWVDAQQKQKDAMQARADALAETKSRDQNAHLDRMAMVASKNQGSNIFDDMPQESIDMLTRAAIKDPDSLNRMRGKNADEIRTRIIKNMPALASAEGLNTDLVSNKAGLHADSGSLSNIQKSLDTITAFENTASGNLDRFINASAALPDLKSPLLNRLQRSFSAGVLGSKQQAAVDTARRVANNEIAKVTTNPNLTGILTNEARDEVNAYNPREATFEQTLEVAKMLRADMAQRKKDLTTQRDTIKTRVAQTGMPTAPTATPSSPPAGAPPAIPVGTTRTSKRTGDIQTWNGTNWE